MGPLTSANSPEEPNGRIWPIRQSGAASNADTRELDKCSWPYIARSETKYPHPSEVHSVDELNELLDSLSDDLGSSNETFVTFFGVGAGAAFGILASELSSLISSQIDGHEISASRAIGLGVVCMAILVGLFLGIGREGRETRILESLRREYRKRRWELRNREDGTSDTDPPGLTG